ncbi:MAG: thioredoxin fold domain-containing protein [Polyangiaceae bacterium]|nr:thioredoxin fold domain-containing protein [Polyangiaceae bacterium]
MRKVIWLLGIMACGPAVASAPPPSSATPQVARIGAASGGAPPVVTSQTPITDADLVWQQDEAAARERARKEHRPMIVDIRAEWCMACKEMQHHTWPDPRVREEGRRFVAVAVDATNEDDPAVAALMKKYGVVGLPTVLLFDGSGKEQARFNQFVNAERMADALRKVQ